MIKKLFQRTQSYSLRQNFIKIFFILPLLVLIYQVVVINQLEVNDISIQEKGRKQAHQIFVTKAHRGNILDRNGTVLAGNFIFKKINLDPTQIQSEFIQKLAQALMITEKELSNAIQKKLNKHAGRKNLVILKNLNLTSPVLKNIAALKKVEVRVCRKKRKKDKIHWIDKMLILSKFKQDNPTYNMVESCKKERIHGVRLQTDMRRYYPKFASLAPLIGRIKLNKKGVSGIEGEFETTLSGQNGIQSLNFKANTKKSYFDYTIQKPLKYAQNITLTIDSVVQFHTYAAIKKSVEKHQADSGSAIVLNASGEILAMANYPADDPNDKTIYNALHYRNRVLSDKLDPGSTMKPFTMLLALEKGKITATDDEFIDVTKRIGHIKPDNKYKRLSVKKILQKSHNLGTVNVSERLTSRQMYKAWQKLGFGKPLGLIPSIENTGLLKNYSLWSLADKRSLSFGYGPMQANLAQLARAYLIFANNGTLLPLKLIKGVNTYEKPIQVFSPESTKKIAHLLDAVASKGGSGYRAQIKGYTVAGKTGTAEMIVDGHYNKDGAKRTFFAGFSPVENPKYIMVARLDYPKKCYASYDPSIKISCGGSNSAAMIFKDAMQNILNTDQSIARSLSAKKSSHKLQ